MSEASEKANDELVVARPESWWRRVSSRKLALSLAAGALLLVLGAGGAAYATYDYSNDYHGRILPGATVAGVRVGGMTPEDALAAVREAIRPQLTRSITVQWGDKTWRTSPVKLGARSDAQAAVDAALDASARASFLDKAKMRLFGQTHDFSRGVAITNPKKGVRGFVEGIAAGINAEPRDAGIDYSSGWVEITPERMGYKVNAGKARRGLTKALEGDTGNVVLPVKTLKPEVKAASFDQVLLLRIGENKLYLYDNGRISHSWTVATGQPEYPTPTGIYSITEKRYMPTWVNPDPTGWGASMPASIPPGSGNPLGLRALNWSAPAIRFHGTSATYSLGFNASHGCVRLSNSDVIALYDMIDVGTPIVSTQVAAFRPLYSTSSSTVDPTVVDNG